MLRLVLAHPHDLAIRPGQPAEPACGGAVRPGERRGGDVEDLVRRRETEGRIRPEPGDRLVAVGGSEEPSAELRELRVDPGGLLEADPMDLVRAQIEGRVGPHELAVDKIAAGHEGEARPVVVAGDRSQVRREEIPVPCERRPDHSLDSRAEIRGEAIALGGIPAGRKIARGIHQRPLVHRSREQVVQLGADAPEERRRRADPAGEGIARRRDMPVDPRPHLAPARDEGLCLGAVPDGLEGGDVQERDLRPVERVDGPRLQAGHDEVALEAQEVHQRRFRHAVGRRHWTVVHGLGALEQAVQAGDLGGDRVGPVRPQAIVEAPIPDQRGEDRVGRHLAVPGLLGESGESARGVDRGHRMQEPVSTGPVRPSDGSTARATAVGVNA